MSKYILWDGGDEVWNNDGSTITIEYSDVNGGQIGIFDPCAMVVWGHWCEDNTP